MTDVPDVDGLVAELRARVEERTREGRYPSELTEEMRQHFERIAAHRAAVDLDVLRRKLDVLENAASFDASRIPLESGMPGGRKLHAAVAKLVSRQTQGALEQVQAFADATREALRTVLLALEEPHGHVHADLVGQVDSLFERLAAFERGPQPPEVAVADLRDRVEALERAARPAPPSPVERDSGAVAALVEGLDPVVGPDDLAAAADGSVGAVVVADLSASELVEVALVARDKLRPGGRLVVDGRNPQSLYGIATRDAPASLHAAYVELVVREAGFGEVRTEWRNQPSDDGSPLDEHIKRLLHAPLDYAVVATR